MFSNKRVLDCRSAEARRLPAALARATLVMRHACVTSSSWGRHGRGCAACLRVREWRPELSPVRGTEQGNGQTARTAKVGRQASAYVLEPGSVAVAVAVHMHQHQHQTPEM
eukprot:scaffold1518_cov109-Isochrysis_galbana.AAC.8